MTRFIIRVVFLLLPLFFALHGAEKDKAKWDNIYSREGYVYGAAPVAFLKDKVKLLPKGRALVLAMGEGRNAVFLAEQGFDVVGVDISEVAVKKALLLAKERGVKIRPIAADLEKYSIEENAYDLITCFNYLQRDLAPQMKKGLKPGGMIIFQTFTIDQLKYKRGPSNKNFLLRRNELLDMFHGMHVVYYSETDTGKKVVASLIAQKKKDGE